MKRPLLVVAFCCHCCIAPGQGLVNFFNNAATLISGENGATISGGAGSYYFGLLTASLGTTDSRLFTFTGCYATNQIPTGRFTGGANVAVPGWPPGAARNFLVCCWPASLGHDWNQSWILGGPIGVSMIASGIAGGTDSSGLPLPPLNLFSSSTISVGFMVSSGCLGPYWMGFTKGPTNQTVVLGGQAVFEVAATACPGPQYQWYFNGVPIPGANFPVYLITNTQASDAGGYSAVLFNPAWPQCCRNNGTGSATLTVLTQPIITTQPQSQSAFVGATVHLQVGANGPAPLNFQWVFNRRVIASGTSPDLWLYNVQVSDSGPYSVAVTNAYGTVTSSTATLSVLAQPPAIVLPPWNRTVPSGRFADFVVKAEGALPLSYQWFFNENALAGGTSSTLHLPAITTSQSGSYRVQVSNAFGATTSTPAVLIVTPAPNYPSTKLVSWGATNALPGAWDDLIAISAGGNHDLALRRDGTVMAWGDDTFGQCAVPAGLSNVVQVGAGTSHSLALKADGSVVAWGWNYRGQTDVPAGLSNVVAIAASGLRSLALTSEGNVVAWGQNMLGEGTIPTNLDGVIAIAAGGYHTLALRFDGRMVAWGYNSYGQNSVPENLTGISAIAAGGDNSMALRWDGTVVCWGDSYYGQSTVPTGLNGVVAIAAGADIFNIPDTACLALKFDGTVAAWGNNFKGQTSVPVGLEGAIAVSEGAYHSLALVAKWPGGKPPSIFSPPSATVEAGSLASFQVRAAGDPPLSVQWFYNSSAIDRATNFLLELRGVELAQAGTYSVAVTNLFGTAISFPAELNVIAPVPRRMLPAIRLTGPVGAAVDLEFTSEMNPASEWTHLATVALTSDPAFYFDLDQPLLLRKFYRARSTGPSVPANPQLSLVPALTLAGAVGSSVRVDWINQFGPTDAWITLGTMILTNSPQLFFDTTAIGQPPRLWRIQPVP